MQFLEFLLANDAGQKLSYGTCAVYATGTTTPVSLFDQSGSPVANPAPADGTGMVGFAAANGTYDFLIKSADGIYSRTIPKQQMFDLQAVANALASGTVAGLVSKVKDTRAHLNSDLAAADSTLGLVYGDPAPANCDLYVKSGASGSGSWVGPLGLLTRPQLRYGTTDPTSSVGIDGDFYINTASSMIFGPKAGGAWPTGLLIMVGAFTAAEVEAVVAEFYGTSEYQIGVAPITGSAASDDTWARNEAAAEDGKITGLEVFSTGTGTFKFYVFDKSGLTFTAAHSVSLPIVAGLNTFAAPGDFSAIPIRAGQYIGQSSGGLTTIANGSTGAGVYASASGDHSTFTSSGLLAGFDLSFRATISVNVLRDVTGALAAANRASSSYLGQVNVVTGSAGSSNVWIMDQAVAEDCSITAVRCFSLGAGPLYIEVFTRSGNDFTRVGQSVVTLASGMNNLALDAPLAVTAGQYIGFFSAGLITFVAGGEMDYRYDPGGHDASFTSSALTGNRFNLGVFLQTDQILQSASIDKQGRACGRFRSRFAFIDNTGQSLAEGSNGTITTTQEHGNLGFAAADADPIKLFPLTVANTQVSTRGENPSYGCLGNIKALLAAEDGITEADDDFQLVACTNGVSGYSITQLNHGTAPYNQAIAQAANLAVLRPDAGFWATQWAQGEQDSVAGMSQATYLGHFKTYATNKADDAKTATGQSYDPVVVVAQMCSNTRPVSYAQLQAANEHPLIILAGPTYQFSYYDSQHRDKDATKQCGGLMGLALKRHLIDNQPWEPLQPVHHVISGNNIDLFFNKDGLTIDTTLMPAQTNYGFDVRDGSDVAQTISSVTIISSRRVRITLSSTPPAGGSVYYGRATMTGRSDSFTGGGGNLRDNQGDRISYAGVALHNWCALFKYDL